MKYNKHLEIIPFVLKDYHLFDKVLVYTELRTVGFENYIIFHCNILFKWVSWYVYKSKEEDNFINMTIDEFYCFMFKVPSEFQWYMPIIYKTGVRNIHPDHILKFFVNDNTPRSKNATRGICLFINFHYLIF